MCKKFETNRTKIKGSCQSARKVVTNDSMSDLPLVGKHLLLFAKPGNFGDSSPHFPIFLGNF